MVYFRVWRDRRFPVTHFLVWPDRWFPVMAGWGQSGLHFLVQVVQPRRRLDSSRGQSYPVVSLAEAALNCRLIHSLERKTLASHQ